MAGFCLRITTMPTLQSIRQPAKPSAAWFARAAALQMIDGGQRDAAHELTRIYGPCGLYLRASSAMPPVLSGHLLQSVLSLHRADGGFAGELRCSDAELPIANGCLALVYALHVLETSPDAAALVDEIARVLQPEGVVLFLVLNPWGLARLRWTLRGPRAIAPATLTQIVRAAGLEVVSCRYLGPHWRADDRLPDPPRRTGSPLAGLSDRLRAVYLLQARRRDVTLTPLRARGAAPTLHPNMRPG